MSQDIQALLSAAGLDTTTFEPTSRYYNQPLTKTVTANGQEVIHTTRRFVPSATHFELLHYHTVEEGDRLDNIAHKYLADAQQYWRICDANNVDQPSQITGTLGHKIKITLPEGVSGAGDA